MKKRGKPVVYALVSLKDAEDRDVPASNADVSMTG